MLRSGLRHFIVHSATTLRPPGNLQTYMEALPFGKVWQNRVKASRWINAASLRLEQPYAIVASDGQPLAMAGLWERWRDRAAGGVLHSFTIITTAPNKLCGAIHDRMPVILPREKWATWLGGREADADELRWMILRPHSAELMRAYPVGQAVGNVRNNDPALLNQISLAA
jgi:putative SOS response-associated peptidase YedK